MILQLLGRVILNESGITDSFLVSQSVSQSVGRLVGRSIGWLVGRSVGRLIGRSVSLPASQSSACQYLLA